MYGELTCRACGELYSPMSSDQPTTYISKRVNRQGMITMVKVPVFACPKCFFKNFAYFPGDVPTGH